MRRSGFLVCIILLIQFQLSGQRVYVVDQGHPGASDEYGDGTAQRPYKTISMAASLTQPGDTVLVYAGVYRERVAPPRSGEEGSPIVYMAADNQDVYIKGSNVWEHAWKAHPDYENIYMSSLPFDDLQNYNPFFVKLARMRESRLSLGQIFCNHERYDQVDSIAELVFSPGTWMMSYDSTEIWLHYKADYFHHDFDQAFIEYSARDKVFAPHIRGLAFIHVEGFIIEHCANQFPSGFYHMYGHPQAGAVSTRSGNNWVIRRNTIRHAKSLAIDCGYEGAFDLEGDQPMPPRHTIGFHLIEYNTIEKNGAGGIHGAQQTQTVIRRNIFRHNGYLNIPAPENGVIKVHFFYDGLIADNLIHDNYVLGIWLDNRWYGTRVTSNTIVNTNGPGIFVEMGNGPCLVDNNIVAFSAASDGIYLHDASGVTIANNLLFTNAHFGVYARIVTERIIMNADSLDELSATKDLRIFNNIFIDNYRGHICLPPEDGILVTNNQSDYNLFINGTQWEWEGLRFNSFSMGSNDRRISKDHKVAVLQNAFDRHQYPDSLRPNYLLWKEQPFLPIDWWRIVYGYDLNSVTPEIHTGNVENGAIEKGEINFSPGSFRLQIANGFTFMNYLFPRVEGVDRDFYGNPVDSDYVIPGPFQQYVEGFNVFRLKNN